jgi:hydrogenase maturation protease
MIPKVLVAGVGNVLLQDDGFGPLAIARLKAEYEIGADAELLDLGTPGLDFMDYLVGREALIILDAVASGGEPGEVLTFNRQQLQDRMPNMRLSAHQPCLQETLFTAETAGACPAEIQLIGIVAGCCDVGTELSELAAAAMPAALETIVASLRRYGVDVQRRAEPLKPDTWWTAPKAFAS